MKISTGSIYALVTVFACLKPHQIFLLFLLFPVPGWLLLPGLITWDFYFAWQDPIGTTDSAAHVGGIIAGFLAYRFRRLRF